MLKLASKAENIDRYTYYELTGNADYTPVGIIGFSRRYARHAGGGQLHYGYEGERWRCLLWGGYAYGVTGILGETGESPGDYRSGRLQAGAALSLRAPSCIIEKIIRLPHQISGRQSHPLLSFGARAAGTGRPHPATPAFNRMIHKDLRKTTYSNRSRSFCVIC